MARDTAGFKMRVDFLTDCISIAKTQIMDGVLIPISGVAGRKNDQQPFPVSGFGLRNIACRFTNTTAATVIANLNTLN